VVRVFNIKPQTRRLNARALLGLLKFIKLKSILQIIITNWIHVVGFLITTYFSLILFEILGIGDGYDWRQLIFYLIISVPFLFVTFGLPVLAGFYIVIAILDFLAFKYTKLRINRILQFEWFLLVIPFVYWAFLYEYWLWITLSVSFFFTQMMRKGMIKNIIELKISNETIAQ